MLVTDPAFPVPIASVYPGVPLQVWLAAQAMQGIIAHNGAVAVSTQACDVAEAMVREMTKRGWITNE